MCSLKPRRFIALACLALLAGCAGGRPLMPTPSLYAILDFPLFTDLNDELARSEVELIYVTDRVPEKDDNGNLYYGYNRSNSLAAGIVAVDLGTNVNWEQLQAASGTQARVGKFELAIKSIEEFERLPPTPTPYQIVDGAIVEDADVRAAVDASVARLHKEMARRLALTPRKDVFLFVHGFHNTFEDAAFAQAELWHFLGREGIPIIYTWPAGFPGIFGYTYDRESGEFTVFHLKQVIRWLSSLPEVENLHIIAHSRGTDVVTSALRELIIEARGAGINARERYKIKNLVLAAPDLDMQVVDQRLIAEKLGVAIGQLTLYSSPDDKAIGFAERIFASPRGRLGTLDLSELSEDEIAATSANATGITIVNFKGKSSSFGHDYFRTNPAVSSDLVLALRYGLKPGDPGRPLEPLGLFFWRIPPGYPADSKSP